MSTWTQEYVAARREYEERVAAHLQMIRKEGERQAAEITERMHREGTLPYDCRVVFEFEEVVKP